MNNLRWMWLGVVFFAFAGGAYAQQSASAPPSRADVIPLTVPKGTPVQVALDKETRIQKAGQPIHGHVALPVYAFDRIVIPAGTEVTGRIAKIEGISGGRRTVGILGGDFTPAHKIDVEFDELILAGGKRMPLHASVTPGSGQTIQFVTAAGDSAQKKSQKSEASDKAKQLKQQARQEWQDAMKQVKEPGRMHRVARYAVALLPVHPQYLDAGTLYFAELEEPLDFGSEAMTPQIAATIGTAPPPGSLVHARLVTPLNSATSHKDELVEAVLSEPLFDGDHLILPQGSRLLGSVVQARPAGHLKRNGQLRIVMHELVPPDGNHRVVDTSLEGVEAGRGDNVKLDSEGGAEATSSKSRYLTTAISLTLAASAARTDRDSGAGSPAGDASHRAEGGAGGFKLVGLALGAAVRSRALGASMGVYGAGMSVYEHFLARGRDVVFAKNTAMVIGIGTRPAPPTHAPSDTPGSVVPADHQGPTEP